MKKLTLNPQDFSRVDPNAGHPKQIFTDISSQGGFAAALDKVIIIMLFLAALLAFIALLYGSIQYLLAAGDAQKAETAKKTILYSIIGLLAIVFIYVILVFVAEGAFG